MTIPFARPVVSEEAIAAATEVLRSGWLGTGPRTVAFEAAFAAYCGAADAVGVTTGTSALHLALVVAGVGPGVEVVTTAMTYVATVHAIVHAGGTPVFADVQPGTGNLDPSSVAERITDRTGAIVVVHYGGLPADLDELRALARDRGIALVEDCAHAAGSTYRGQRIGGGGELQAFSLQATKNLTGAGGGVLTVASPEVGQRVRRLRNLGIDHDSFARASGAGPSSPYEVTEVGFSCAMNDLHAAIALHELDGLDARNARRAELAQGYRDHLGGVAGITLLDRPADRTSNEHLVVVLAERRDDLLRRLADEGVVASVHYRRVDSFSAYQPAELPVTARFAAATLSLPMHDLLTEADVEHVCRIVRGGW